MLEPIINHPRTPHIVGGMAVVGTGLLLLGGLSASHTVASITAALCVPGSVIAALALLYVAIKIDQIIKTRRLSESKSPTAEFFAYTGSRTPVTPKQPYTVERCTRLRAQLVAANPGMKIKSNWYTPGDPVSNGCVTMDDYRVDRGLLDKDL